MNPRRLYRSRDRQLAGVAGGMAEYLDVDPTVIRILWIVLGIVSVGFALIAYLVLALVIPQAPYGLPPYGPAPSGPWPGTAPVDPMAATAGTAGWSVPPASPGWAAPQSAPAWSGVQPSAPRAESRGLGAGAIIGIMLIVLGTIALLDAALPAWHASVILGPAAILAVGAALVVASIRRPVEHPAGQPFEARAAVPQAPAPAGPVASPDWDPTTTQTVDPGVEGSEHS